MNAAAAASLLIMVGSVACVVGFALFILLRKGGPKE